MLGAGYLLTMAVYLDDPWGDFVLSQHTKIGPVVVVGGGIIYYIQHLVGFKHNVLEVSEATMQ